MAVQPFSLAASLTSKPHHDLYCIVYVSTAARSIALPELMHLVNVAQRRNAEENVTGLLLYSGVHFMQCLEGPARGLATIYELIKASHLHYGLVDLVRSPIKEREFGQWSMGFHVANGFGMASPAAQDEEVVKALTAPGSNEARSRDLLASFWLHGRGALCTELVRHKLIRRERQWADSTIRAAEA